MKNERRTPWAAEDYAPVAVAHLTALGLLDFSKKLIAHGRAGHLFTDDALAKIQATCVLALKDSGVQGLPIHLEAQAMQEAVALLQQHLRAAIAPVDGSAG